MEELKGEHKEEDYQVRVAALKSALKKEIDTAGLFIGKNQSYQSLVDRLSAQLSRLPGTVTMVVGRDDMIQEGNQAIHLFKKLSARILNRVPDDKDYDNLLLMLSDLKSCLDKVMIGGGNGSLNVSEPENKVMIGGGNGSLNVSEPENKVMIGGGNGSLNVSEPEKTISGGGNGLDSGIPKAQSPFEILSEAIGVQSSWYVLSGIIGVENELADLTETKQIAEAEFKGFMDKSEKQVIGLSHLVTDVENSQKKKVESIEFVQFRDDVIRSARILKKQVDDKASSAMEELKKEVSSTAKKFEERLKTLEDNKDLKNHKCQVKKMLKRVVSVKGLKKHTSMIKLKNLVSVKDLKKHTSKVEKKLKILTSGGGDLKKVEEKLENLESAGVRELKSLQSRLKYYIWWVVGSFVVLSLRGMEITPSGLLNSPLWLMVLLGAIILWIKYMNR